MERRTLLVRIIEVSDAESVDNIIKATNSQTSLGKASLHATEQIHRRIEILLKDGAVGLYYDRRKNYYKNRGKAARDIISMPRLAQALASLVLQEPNEARGRPTTVSEKHYSRLFDPKAPPGLYGACALALRRVSEYLEDSNFDRTLRLNLVFHLLMYSACVALGSAKPQRRTIAELRPEDLTDALLDDCLKQVQHAYDEAGGDDKASKGTDFVGALIADLNSRLAALK